jgi:hypothetical protein
MYNTHTFLGPFRTQIIIKIYNPFYQELVYGAVDDYYMDKLLPDPGIWLAVEVTTILTPGHFYVSLPFGKTPTDNLKEKEGKCTNFMVW